VPSKALRFMTNNVVGFLALFIALGGVGYAASGGFTSSGKLAACVNEEGRLKLLKSGERCKRHERSLWWNQTGPAGTKGGAGAPGASGPAGASIQGPKGETGASGQPTNVLWARIDEDGVIETEGHGVIEVKDNGESPYTVTFNRDVSQCAVVASQDSPIANYEMRDVRHLSSLGKPDKVRLHIEVNPSIDVASGFSIIATC
jgi:hypothetical protein